MSENKNVQPYSQSVSRVHVRQEYHEEIDEPETVTVKADALKCPTCLEFFRNAPVMLACGHSFCQDCMLMIKQSRQTRLIRCPICRQQSSNEAQKNYAVGQIVDSADSYVERSASSQACQNLKFK
uniref:RING-type domain-containing protein n=1 Tax=Steinernema glaseri TaxID=37863 RepID=A0A1I8AL49_9BILA